MSKEKPDKVVVHRIEFQKKERELIEGLTTAYALNRVATPIVALLSDVSAMTLLTSIYVGYRYGEQGLALLTPEPETVGVIVQDLQNIYTAIPVGLNIGIENSLFAPLSPLFSFITQGIQDNLGSI